MCLRVGTTEKMHPVQEKPFWQAQMSPGIFRTHSGLWPRFGVWFLFSLIGFQRQHRMEVWTSIIAQGKHSYSRDVTLTLRAVYASPSSLEKWPTAHYSSSSGSLMSTCYAEGTPVSTFPWCCWQREAQSQTAQSIQGRWGKQRHLSTKLEPTPLLPGRLFLPLMSPD